MACKFESSSSCNLQCTTCNTQFQALIPSLPDTPVPGSFTQSGSAFSSNQVSEIRDAVSTATEGVNVLDNNISQLEALLVQCKEARRSHTEFIRHHTSLLSFARRLPAEIWGLVFEWAMVDTPLDGTIFQSANPRTMPMIATHTCRYWRRIAISTSRLWTKVHLRVAGTFPESKLHLLNAWLTRSGASPLDVKADVVSPSWSMVPQETKHRFPQAIDILISHAHRWRQVELRLWPEVYQAAAFPILSAPYLECMSIATRDFYLAPAWTPIFVKSAPLLRHVTLDNFLPSLSSFQGMFPWTTVSDMRLGSGRAGLHYTTHEALTILSIMPNLVSFTAGCMPDFDGSPEGDPVHHLTLTNLSLRTGNTRLLALLTAPSLQYLELSSLYTMDENNIRSFILRCPQLKHLVLDDSNLAFISSLRRDCPVEILELRLTKSDLADGQLNAFASLAESAYPALPRLSSVKVRLSFLSPRDGGGDSPVRSLQLLNSIVALTRRRSSEGGGLRDITIRMEGLNASDVTREAFSNLRELGLEGLDLDIS